METATPACFKIIDFITEETTTEAVAQFRPSSRAQQRAAAKVRQILSRGH